jgi:NAD(P)H-dependent flavin oxidoreductase YrpB (nitropropane dioxygenase family)
LCSQIKELTAKGILPMAQQGKEDVDKELSFQEQMDRMPLLMGQAAGAISDVQPAQQIMEEMVAGAIAVLRSTNEMFVTVDDVANAAARL